MNSEQVIKSLQGKPVEIEKQIEYALENEEHAKQRVREVRNYRRALERYLNSLKQQEMVI